MNRYAKARRRALQMASWIADNVPAGSRLAGGRDVRSIVQDIEGCGNLLEFQDATAEGDTETRLSAGKFCGKFRLDPLCAIRRQARWLRETLPKLMGVIGPYLASEPYATVQLMTPTIKSGRSLHRRFAHLTRSWRAWQLDRRRFISSKSPRAQYTELSRVAGGVFAIEIKRGSGSKQWHPHLHAVVLCEAPLDQERLQSEWRRITRDSFMVDVRDLYSLGGLRSMPDTADEAVMMSLADDLQEVVKYAVKFGDMTLRDNWLVERVVFGRRLRGSFGNFHGIPMDTDQCCDDVFEDRPYITRVAEWVGDSYELSTVEQFQPDEAAPF
ncbi:protein rep [Planctomycetales bacterium ZRK34]|nr:protein rep [Planctomycetales bacterium ZRK34]